VSRTLEAFYRHLSRPLLLRSRVLLALLVVPLGLSFTAPLWNIHMLAPQYPDGLDLEIYAHTIGGDVQEVNTLNHYIGMAHIDRASLSDLDWIPFAIGALIVLTLRVAAIGENRSLVDLFVLFAYFSAFSMGRFAYKLYVFGHNLDPKAPFTVEPFTPALLGTKQIANFTTTSLPQAGTLWVGVFGVGLLVVLTWNWFAAPREGRGAVA
jgi:copper chaperone NosL